MGRMSAPLVFVLLLAAAPAATTSAPAVASAPRQDVPLDPAEFEKRLAADGLTLDRARKEVRLRGDLLRRRRSPEYPVEYGLVVEGGFTHEAFGIVKCTPSLLNACFLALGLQPGLARRRVMKQPLPPREEVETGLTEPFEVLPPQGDRVFLYVLWKEADGKEVVRAFEDFFVDLRSMKPLPMRGYVYLGSRFDEIQLGLEKKRVFIADYEGNIVTLHPDKSRAENCLFDVYSFDDEPYVWADVDEDKLPPEGAPLEFVFTLLPRPDARPFEPEPPRVPIPLPSARELAKKSTNPCLDGSNDEWLDKIGARDLHDVAAILQRGRGPLREVAAELLGAARRDEAVEPLQLSLRFDRSADVRLACAYALVEIGSPAALSALVDVLERGAILARDDALVALRYASGEDFGQKPIAWRSWIEQRRAAGK
jgi:hypothetical protein